jgi:RNA polymerase sigma-70 factor (ECF subfamily)
LKEAEFLHLVNKHAGVMNKILYLYVDDPEDKRDLKQEILLQTWKSMKNFKGDSAFSTWFYRVALNTVLTFRKKDKSKLNTSLEQDLTDPGHSNPTEKSEILFRAIRLLNDIDKTVITLHLEDYSNEEISEITGLTKNNVAVKLHRIKEALTKKLKNIGHG